MIFEGSLSSPFLFEVNYLLIGQWNCYIRTEGSGFQTKSSLL